MNKDRVVIDDGGIEYVMAQTDDVIHSCKDSGCALYAECGRNCREEHYNVFMFCAGAHDQFERSFTCISATKIEPSPKMYFAWNREEARRLIGKEVEYYIDGIWCKSTLENIATEACDNHPYYFEEGNVGHVREIPTIKLTRAELNEKYGVPDNVVIVD